MKEYRDYDILLPDLVYDILDYFRVGNDIMPSAEKSVLNYCQTSLLRKDLPMGDQIQPYTIYKICENLVKKGYLNRLGANVGILGMKANYLYLPKKEDVFLNKSPELVFHLNCLAYGFRYIYESYCNYVLPIVVKKSGDITMGTCFRFHTGIVTAKHCLEADEVFIPGYTINNLNQGTVLVSNDQEIDLAYIELGDSSPLLSGEAQVLDEVLVMGYPKIPMFMDFCAAERATISSVPTCGAIASLANQYISKNAGKLMLVTARIRGGNSGGPIIDSDGAVVGVAFSEPMSKGDYDEMGYGIAYPIKIFYQILQNHIYMNVNFVNEIS